MQGHHREGRSPRLGYPTVVRCYPMPPHDNGRLSRCCKSRTALSEPSGTGIQPACAPVGRVVGVRVVLNWAGGGREVPSQRW